MPRPSRSSRNRIALGCCLAACVVIVAAGVVSAFWVTTYYYDWSAARLHGGSIKLIYIPIPSPYPAKPIRKLLYKGPAFTGIKFDLPSFQGRPNGSIAGTLPLWLPLAVLTIPAFILWRRGLFPRVLPGHCPCGYSLTGNQSGVCPECGAKVQPVASAE